MMQEIEITTQSGEPIRSVPCLQLQVNPDQSYFIVGCDLEEFGGLNAINDNPGFKSTHIGKLNELSYILQQQLINSLTLQGWDWDSCLVPEVLLIDRIPTNG